MRISFFGSGLRKHHDAAHLRLLIHHAKHHINTIQGLERFHVKLL